MIERLMRILAYLILVVFLGILVYRLNRMDLTVVVGLTLALAGWDFFWPRKKT